MQPHVLLAGGGHAHLPVVAALTAAARVTLIDPSEHAIYSGMVPGVIAGQYPPEAARIDLRRLTRRHGARLVIARVVQIDAVGRAVVCSNGTTLGYDLLSLDLGSQPAGGAVIGDGANVVAIRPMADAMARIDGVLDQAGGRAPQIAVVGAGAGGVEVAFAIAARLRRCRGSVHIFDRAERPLATRAARAGGLVLEAFRRAGIRFHGGRRVTGVAHGRVLADDDSSQAADLVIWATGAAAPAVLRDSGLPVDARGCLRVGDDLRCRAYPEIFAAGDCAALDSYPELAKAGVYAVRQGPVLASNLLAALRGGATSSFVAQPRFLALLNTCDGAAIASYGGFAVQARAAWWWKDRIDRRFVAQWRSL